jgi:hypothetical protein
MRYSGGEISRARTSGSFQILSIVTFFSFLLSRLARLAFLWTGGGTIKVNEASEIAGGASRGQALGLYSKNHCYLA